MAVSLSGFAVADAWSSWRGGPSGLSRADRLSLLCEREGLLPGWWRADRLGAHAYAVRSYPVTGHHFGDGVRGVVSAVHTDGRAT